MSPLTVNIDLRTLRAAFNYALRWNLVSANPFARVPLCLIPKELVALKPGDVFGFAVHLLPISLVPLPTLSYTEHCQAAMDNRACGAYGA